MGELTSGRVIFGPDHAEPLLGVTALESVGILVDPANRTLKRVPAIPLKSARLFFQGPAVAKRSTNSSVLSLDAGRGNLCAGPCRAK